MRHSSCSAFLCLFLSSLMCLLLGGCARGTSGPPTPDAGAAIAGRVMGAQAPLVGAQLYLLAANTTGYGGAGIAASSSNASLSLLSAAETGTSDSLGAYVATGSNGGFSLAGDYTCTSGQQLYLYILGGTNSAAGLMAAIGSCPASVSSAITATVNEVTTIAAAYAFAGFATDATHVSSSGTALAQVGIANAFANAANLASLSNGTALATTPAGNGTVPQAEINTLANILADCVDTSGPGSNGCQLLFTNAMSGGSSGTAAADTATAAINIAHNPGANVTTLYGLASTAVFAPKLSAQPNDFIIGLNFAGGGAVYPPYSVAIDGAGNVWFIGIYDSVFEYASLGVPLSPSTGYTGGGLSNSFSIAIDGSGNAWIANYYEATVSKLSSAGVALSPSAGYTGGGLDVPTSIAIDGSGNAWIANSNAAAVSKFSSTGTALSPTAGYMGGGLDGPASIAIDGSGDAWTANFASAVGVTVSKISSAGTAISPSSGFTGGGLYSPRSIAIDSAGNAWIANEDYDRVGHTGSISKFSSAGTALSPPTGYTGGGLLNPVSIAIDGSGNVWTANLGSVSEFSGAGAALSPSFGYGYAEGFFDSPQSIAIDGSGNAWVANDGNYSVSELIGVAAPVITPICAGLPATPTVDGSSKLGTRP